MKSLFIGNSATYVHDIPGTLSRLAKKAGYSIETTQITPGGFSLAQHADVSTEHGQRVFEELSKGYDHVYFQDDGGCIGSDETKTRSADAAQRMMDKAKANGSKVYFYVRPPYGKEKCGYTAYEQCRELDKHFLAVAAKTGAECIYVNRAFACAIESLDCNLWGDDNAHTSVCGAYLIVCTFFASLFNESATVLDCDSVDENTARKLQQIADRVVFEGYYPWHE